MKNETALSILWASCRHDVKSAKAYLVIKRLMEERPHGEWKHDQFGDFFKSVLCSNCGIRSAFEFPFCPNCGTPMTEEAFRKYNGVKEGEAE